MTEKISNSNPLLDAWINGQEQFSKAQQEWLESVTEFADNLDKSESIIQTEENWAQCKQQFNSWMKTTENWFPSFSNFNNSNDDITVETVKKMLDPTNFLKSGLDEINQAFYKLVDAPEFADIGIYERQFLKNSKYWVELRNASAEYMAVTSEAWTQTFEEYTKDVSENPITEKDSPRDLLDRWLKIANKNLIEQQRTDRFLEAQRNLISSGTRYRLKQREFVEIWCEGVSIPTRTEVDDLHRTLYELRREVRMLKRQITEKSSSNFSDVNNYKFSSRKFSTTKNKIKGKGDDVE